MPNQTILSLRGINKSYRDQVALHQISLDIQHGEFLTLLGPSGCGKTTLLRLISGFESPDSGQIIINGQNLTTTPPENRHINMVFQSYALFPHMTIFQNVAFGLECQGVAKDQIKSKVTAALERVQLIKLQDRHPNQLSGGQQQRVAIARAMVKEPLLLLLDEPLSALDYSLRKQLRIELKTLQRELGITFILVTHDQEEALTLSDRIVVMNEGMIEQIGKPRDVYEEPTNLFVTRFIGEANIFETTVKACSDHHLICDISDQEYTLKNKKNFKTGDKINVIVRPEDVEAWDKSEVEDHDDFITAAVVEVIYKGSTVDLVLKLSNGQIVSASEFFDEDDEKLEYNIGDTVYIDWKQGWEHILRCEERSDAAIS